MTANDSKWKPGDTFKLALLSGVKGDAEIHRVIELEGIREFAVHRSGEGFSVSHIPTGTAVGRSWSRTQRGAVYRALRRARQVGAAAIRAALERDKEGI